VVAVANAFLECASPARRRLVAQIAPALVHPVERHKHGRRCTLIRRSGIQQVDVTEQLGVERAQFTIEDQRARDQLRDSARDVTESGCVVAAISRHETDASPSLNASIRQLAYFSS